ncbi:MAG: hypothetical protein K2X00_17560 [Nitrospiraceae bacterium]|nr:hypothetical protein [Nitrospiraceae bacterium]
MAIVIRAFFGQGPRVSHEWWTNLHICWNSHNNKGSFSDYVAMLFEAGMTEFKHNPNPGMLIGEARGIVSSRSKSLPYAPPLTDIDDKDDVCRTLAIKSDDDLIAILVGIGYDVVCLQRRGLAA